MTLNAQRSTLNAQRSTLNAQRSTLALILTSSLFLTACGGGSSNSDSSSAAGVGVDYTGKTTAATEIPSTEAGKEALANAIVQVLLVQNIPLFRANDFGDDIAEEKKTCTEGETSYANKTQRYDSNYDQVVAADVNFKECSVNKDSSEASDASRYNGMLIFKRDETKVSSTDSYQFKQLSIVNNGRLSGYNSYYFDGSFIWKNVLNKNNNVEVSHNWDFSARYSNPAQDIEFISKGSTSYIDIYIEDHGNNERIFPATYKSSFTIDERTYQLEYRSEALYSYDYFVDQVKFYDSEFGFYNLNIDHLNAFVGKGCEKNGKYYSGIQGEVLLKDASGTNLMSVSVDCDDVTYQ